MQVCAGPLTLCLKNEGPTSSAVNVAAYSEVRKHHGLGEVWRAHPPQNWFVRLVRAPFEGEVTDALLQRVQTPPALCFA